MTRKDLDRAFERYSRLRKKVICDIADLENQKIGLNDKIITVERELARRKECEEREKLK